MFLFLFWLPIFGWAVGLSLAPFVVSFVCEMNDVVV